MLQAHLLIAQAELAQPFGKSVVLLIQHTEEGAWGLILNQRTSASLEDAWNKLSDVPCHRQAPIFLGGPCEGPLVALHNHEFLLEVEVMPGVYVSTSRDKLETLAAQKNEGRVKFFAGYSGWGAGQLENEIARGSWSVMPATPQHVFEFEDELWRRASRHVADAAWRTMLNIKEAPADPRVN